MPLEKDDNCGTTVLVRLEDGRLRAQRVDCKTKACPRCGPKLRQHLAEVWAQVMADEVVYLWEGPDSEWVKLQRRKVMRGAEHGVIPGPDGTRAVYSTAPIGPVCEDVPLALTSDFAGMPNDPRHRGLSVGWRRRAECIEAFTAPARGEGPKVTEFLGIIRAGLEHARQLAREFRVYEEEAGLDGSAFIFRQPDDPLEWRRFKRWAGLEEPGRKRRSRRRLKLGVAA